MIVKEQKKMTGSGKEEYHVTESKSKRIGFFAAILVVIGSCVGTGIFFKSGSIMANTEYSILLALGCWIIAGFAVVAMGIDLIDIATQGKQDSLGIVSWAHTFNNLFLYKSNKNFYSFIFIPVKFFVIPVYICQSLQSGLSYVDASINPLTNALELGSFGKQIMDMPWWSLLLIVMGINTFFILVAGLSVSTGNKINMAIMYVKFVPIAFAFIIGFVVLGISHGGLQGYSHWTYEPNYVANHAEALGAASAVEGPKQFVLMSPVIGVIMSLSAIFYAYDGFYVAAGIQGELKEPKKISLVILVGLLTVTAMYLGISFSITIGAENGNWTNIGIFFVERKVSWIYTIMALLISIGILTEVDVYSMWFPMYFQQLIENREVPFAKSLSKYTNRRKPIAGVIYLLVVVSFFTIALTLIGVFGFQDKLNASAQFGDYVSQGNNQVAYLYMFSDLISNWQTVFTFVFLSLTILGWFGREVKAKTKKQDVMHKVKLACAIISSSVMFIAMAFQIADPFVNLAVNLEWNNAHPEKTVSIISQATLIGVLGGFIIITFLPSWFESRSKQQQDIFNLENKAHSLKLRMQDLEEQKIVVQNKAISNDELSSILKENEDVPVIANAGGVSPETN